jgi:hypothetical protein
MLHAACCMLVLLSAVKATNRTHTNTNTIHDGRWGCGRVLVACCSLLFLCVLCYGFWLQPGFCFCFCKHQHQAPSTKTPVTCKQKQQTANSNSMSTANCGPNKAPLLRYLHSPPPSGCHSVYVYVRWATPEIKRQYASGKHHLRLLLISETWCHQHVKSRHAT